MNQAEKAELLEQIEKWNDADEFARCIEAIESIPEQERDYLLTLKLGRAYSNLAVLGDHGALGENAEVDGDLLRHAIDLLESVRTQGENDPYWAMFFYYGNGYWWKKGIPAQPENMDAYFALEKQIMEKHHLKEPFEWE